MLWREGQRLSRGAPGEEVRLELQPRGREAGDNLKGQLCRLHRQPFRIKALANQPLGIIEERPVLPCGGGACILTDDEVGAVLWHE